MSNGQTLSPARMADINIKCYRKELSCIRTKAAGAIIFNLLRNFHKNDRENEVDVMEKPEPKTNYERVSPSWLRFYDLLWLDFLLLHAHK